MLFSGRSNVCNGYNGRKVQRKVLNYRKNGYNGRKVQRKELNYSKARN